MLRRLPDSPPEWERAAEIVVVGSGAAGMSAALAAARHGRHVLLLAKDGLDSGATPLAQGGLAAAVDPGDDPWMHCEDTLVAGAGLCDPAPVAALAAQAPAVVARLAALGARLDHACLRLEGGHSRRRIVHAGDATGAEVHRALAEALAASTVEVMTGVAALDLLLDESGAAAGLLAGLIGDDGASLRPGTVIAPAVVLATGGLGQAFAVTSNPAGATGDGLALAARAGADIRDAEFVQFHPTVLWEAEAHGRRPLVTEALRGAGALLVDEAGRRVLAGRHPLGDLAPRDVVAAAMQERMAESGSPHLWLDATGLDRRSLEEEFPTVTAFCRARGIDPAADPIPVAPGAHYACGGIRAGLDGRTSVQGLYAVGEVASTGVHGANRLASNSLIEALLAGDRAGGMLGRCPPAPRGRPLLPPPGSGLALAARPLLAEAMWRHAGLLRDQQGLDHLLDLLDCAPADRGPQRDRSAWASGAAGWQEEAGGAGEAGVAAGRSGSRGNRGDAEDLFGRGSGPRRLQGRAGGGGSAAGGWPQGPPDLPRVEAANLHAVSVLVAAGAAARRESRGCHRRRDAPFTLDAAEHTVLRWRDGVLRVESPGLMEVGA